MTVVSKKKHELEPEQELPVEDLKAEAEQAAEQPAEQTPAEPETAAAEPETEAAPQQPDTAQQLKAAEDRYMRLAAEYDNFRKRSARERDALFADVRSDTVVKFLPVYDNLLRAIAMTPEGDPGRKGIEMTLTQFETVLTKLGVTPIEALGQSFDPALHNAVMHTEDPEQGESVVVEEFEKGFKMGDKVIRFSMVKVAN
ncbi:MAG: nucleotide exchange factor GrpE [Oscillospiraceae bacterium]|nr:nucleotide exchange factor GrpE [Oscillospiraceae bacterium]